jgi:uncharacterized protein (DUF4415 family)
MFLQEHCLQFCTYNYIGVLERMKNKKRAAKSGKKERRAVKSSSAGTRRKSRQSDAGDESKRHAVSMGEVLEYYRPLKKPVTLRLDADVVAWFKRDGRRYQTRINAALRRVMEREMKDA